MDVANNIGDRIATSPLSVIELERFTSKIEYRESDQCWLWKAAVQTTGYGAIKIRGRMVLAHRLAWVLAHGPMGESHVLHHCDTPRCCNPSHLFLGTPLDNARDRNTKRRHAYGTKQGSAKLDAARVKQIREDVRSNRIVAAAMGVSKTLVQNIKKGTIWAHC